VYCAFGTLEQGSAAHLISASRASRARNRWRSARPAFQESPLFLTLFKRVVQQCIEAGLLKGADLSIDSTQISANASSDRAISSWRSPKSIARYASTWRRSSAKTQSWNRRRLLKRLPLQKKSRSSLAYLTIRRRSKSQPQAQMQPCPASEDRQVYYRPTNSLTIEAASPHSKWIRIRLLTPGTRVMNVVTPGNPVKGDPRHDNLHDRSREQHHGLRLGR
jgi:hypothetical protein